MIIIGDTLANINSQLFGVRKVARLILVVYPLLCLSSCSIDTSKQTDVFVCGGSGNFDQATYWKNGTPILMSRMLINVTSVFVSNGNLYMVGSDRSSITSISNHEVATLWKNGTITLLTDTTIRSAANSIYISNQDVYVAGYEFLNNESVATYWKNGVPVTLTDGTYGAIANSITVSGNDVIVAGTENTPIMINGIQNQVPIVKYWKNGIPFSLSDPAINSFFTSLFVDGADIYVAGILETASNRWSAVYWKNGQLVNLSSSGSAFTASIWVSNGDVYVAGTMDNQATIWKNGVAKSLRNSDSWASAAVTFGSDLYVAGYFDGSFGYLKNGVLTTLPTAEKMPSSIFVSN